MWERAIGYLLFVQKSNFEMTSIQTTIFVYGDTILEKYKTIGNSVCKHEAAFLNSHNHNLPILVGFLNQQTATPHNQSIKK